MGKNKSYGDKLFITIVYVLMGLISLVCLYPMWHVIMASFSDPIEPMLCPEKDIWESGS